MTKTALEHASVTKIPVKKNDIKEEENEPSESPPLVIKFLETLPPEKELTFIVEVVESQPPPQTKIVVQNPGPQQVLFLDQQPKFKVPFVTSSVVASVVKSEVKIELDEDFEDLEEEEEEDPECLRIIEETVVDVSTLPGRPPFLTHLLVNDLAFLEHFFVVAELTPFFFCSDSTRESLFSCTRRQC